MKEDEYVESLLPEPEHGSTDVMLPIAIILFVIVIFAIYNSEEMEVQMDESPIGQLIGSCNIVKKGCIVGTAPYDVVEAVAKSCSIVSSVKVELPAELEEDVDHVILTEPPIKRAAFFEQYPEAIITELYFKYNGQNYCVSPEDRK